MASMSLAGVLACFMGNDMGCDCFFWLLLAEWFGLGVALLGLPSYPVVQKLSPVLTEHGVVTPVSLRTWRYGALFRYGLRIWQSLSLCLGVACGVRLDFREMLGTQCLVRQWMVSVVSGCCLWGTIGFAGDARDAMLGSTVDGLRCVWVLLVSNWDSVEMLRAQFLVRQWIHILHQLREVLGRISHIFHVAEDSYSALLSPFSRRTEKCAQQMLQFTVFSRCSHREIWTLFL